MTQELIRFQAEIAKAPSRVQSESHENVVIGCDLFTLG